MDVPVFHFSREIATKAYRKVTKQQQIVQLQFVLHDNRYHVPRKGKPNEEWKHACALVQTRVGKVLLSWIHDHWIDFSMPLVNLLKSFIDNDLRLDGNLALVKSLSAAINSKV